MYANTHRDSQKRSNPFEVEDFMPGTRDNHKQQEQSTEDQAARLRAWARGLGAIVKRRGDTDNGAV